MGIWLQIQGIMQIWWAVWPRGYACNFACVCKCACTHVNESIFETRYIHQTPTAII